MTESTKSIDIAFFGQKSDVERDAVVREVSSYTGSFALFLGFVLLVAATSQPSWQLFTLLSAMIAYAFICFFISRRQLSVDLNTTIMIMVVSNELILAMISIIISDVWVLCAILSLIYTLLIASSLLSGGLNTAAIHSGLISGVIIVLLGAFSPIEQVTLNAINVLMPVIIIFSIAIYISLIVRGLIITTMRVRLITILLIVVIIPLILVSFIETIFLQNAASEQINTSLKLAAEQVSARVDDFLSTNLESIGKEAMLPVFSNYLLLPNTERDGSEEASEVQLTLSTLRIVRKTYSPAYSIMDLTGEVVVDSNPLQVGQSYRDKDYFRIPIQTNQSFVSPIEFSNFNGDPYIFFCSPIRDSSLTTLGVLCARYDALVFQNMLSKYVGLIGARSYPIMVDENYFRIADTFTPRFIYHSLADRSAQELDDLEMASRLPDIAREDLSTNSTNLKKAIDSYATSPFFTIDLEENGDEVNENGIVVKISGQPWYVIYVQEETYLIDLRNNQGRLTGLVASIISAIIGFIATAVSSRISQPIVKLTETARKISGGDFNIEAEIQSFDETGALAHSFNLMTKELRGFINELGDRVKERTAELAQQNDALLFRSRQLQTVSDVARSITTSQELDKLLSQVCNLISERFEFYHVGIFMVDDRSEFALLKAANSEGGKRMLARHHKLRIGQVGIVGYVCANGQPRIATDVGQDAVFFNNPDLPLTRSEMALPLKSGNRVIGALDVQSTLSNAFRQEDIELFATLADQVAVAIINNQLYQDTLQALQEAQTLHRQYMRQEWTKDTATRSIQGYHYTQDNEQIRDEVEISAEMAAAIVNAKPVMTNAEDGKGSTALAIPIMLRGETIGVIEVQEKAEKRGGWSEDEVDSVQSIADQVGLALESARLFEQTVRRADRERKVLEITSRIRSTNNPQEMMQIAVEELQKVLHVSRAQVLIQPENLEKPISPDPISGNGHMPENGNHSKAESDSI